EFTVFEKNRQCLSRTSWFSSVVRLSGKERKHSVQVIRCKVFHSSLSHSAESKPGQIPAHAPLPGPQSSESDEPRCSEGCQDAPVLWHKKRPQALRSAPLCFHSLRCRPFVKPWAHGDE